MDLSPDESMDEEMAETTLLNNLEERRRTAIAGGSRNVVWDASVDGEHPLLGNVPMGATDLFSNSSINFADSGAGVGTGAGDEDFDQNNGGSDDAAAAATQKRRSGTTAKMRFRDLARRARMMKKTEEGPPLQRQGLKTIDAVAKAALKLKHLRKLSNAGPLTPNGPRAASSSSQQGVAGDGTNAGDILAPVPRRPSSADTSFMNSRTSFPSNLDEFNQSSNLTRRQRQQKKRYSLFHEVGGDGETDIGNSHVAVSDTKTDRLIMGALAVDRLYHGHDDGSTSTGSDTQSGSFSTIAEESEDSTIHDEDSPLMMDDFGIDPNGGEAYGATTHKKVKSSKNQRKSKSKRKKKKSRRKANALQRWFVQFNASMWEVVNPVVIWRGLMQFLLHSTFTYVTIPCLALAFLCYYQLGNPRFGCMIGKSTISWWLVFFARQALIFEMAKMTDFFIVDGLALRSRWIVKLLGPLVTLLFIQSKGWPSLAVCWVLWDFALMHGSGPFQQNWAFEFNIALFSPANHGGPFLYSNLYTNLLVAVLVAGLANSVKRTTVAMYFGKRTFVNYREKLVELLTDIAILTEVAQLSTEIEAAGFGDATEDTDDSETDHVKPKRPSNNTVTERRMKNKWAGVGVGLSHPSKRHDSEEIVVVSSADADGDEDDAQEFADAEIDRPVDDNGDHNGDHNGGESDPGHDPRGIHHRNRPFGNSSRGSSAILHTLDNWKEPVNKLDKVRM